MTQIERITEMERRLDASTEALKQLSDALDAYEENRDALKKLMDYYGSSRWRKDFEADEKGKLPQDLKRGVLSEDTIYDLIFDHHDLIARMSQYVTEAINWQML